MLRGYEIQLLDRQETCMGILPFLGLFVLHCIIYYISTFRALKTKFNNKLNYSATYLGKQAIVKYQA